MHITDKIYGTFEISEPVLVAILQTQAVQRLKGVLQHGITGLIGITSPTTRYEHSVGVMLLVRRLGGDLEEQIAALLHDVSHTAFSHVIDYVFNQHDQQGYHEAIKLGYVASTDIPSVLDHYGYNWQDVLDEERFSLLEQPAPALCADRLDYFLRDSLELGLAGQTDLQCVLDHLVVREGKIGVDDSQAAGWIGNTFIAADERSWANFREVGLYELTARALRTALQIGLLQEADFMQTDAWVWQRLQSAHQLELQRQVQLISPDTRFVKDEHQADFWVSTKLRTIDPDVLVEGHLIPYSKLNPDFASLRQNYLARKQGKWPFKVIPGASRAGLPGSSQRPPEC
jgi:HD superfamily phosphohydrolase